MSRVVSVAAAVLLVACGGSPKPASAPPPTPVANDQPAKPTPESIRPEDLPKYDNPHEDMVPTPPPPASKPPPPPPQPPPAQPKTATIASGKATVTVLSKGKGKRQKLRYAFVVGKKHVVFTMQVKTDAGMKMVMPTMSMGFDLEVLDVDKDGTAHIKETLTDTTSTDAPDETVQPAQMDAVMKKLVGMTVETTVSALGEMGSQTYTMPAGAPDMMSTMQQLATTVIMPTAPVGVGARWRVSADVVTTMRATVTSEYHLKSHKGGVFVLDGTSTVTGAPQDMPSGAHIEKIDGSGTFDLTLDPRNMFPAGTAGMSMTLGLKVGGQSMTATTDMATTTTIQ